MGPWYHGQWASPAGGWNLGDVHFGSNTSVYYQNNIEIPFFNYYLKGKGEDFRAPFSGEETKRLMGKFLVS